MVGYCWSFPEQRASHVCNLSGIDGSALSSVRSFMALSAASLMGGVPLTILIKSEGNSLFFENSFIAVASSGGIVCGLV